MSPQHATSVSSGPSPLSAPAILTLKKLRGQAFPLTAARHNRRTIQAELGAAGHIDPKRTHLNRTLAGADTPEGVAAQARELMQAAGIPKKLRKDAVTALEAVFSIPESIVIDREAYFAKCLAWIADEFGGMGNILSADIHNDEAHPHLHVLMLPLREGRMNGSDMMGNRQTMERRQRRFYSEVAKPFGFPKPPARLAGAARADAVALVVGALNARNDPVLRSVIWPAVRAAIEKDPAAWLSQLELKVPERTQRRRSSTDIFISPGKGPKKEVNPRSFGFKHSQTERSLSCVGFAPDTAEVSAQEPVPGDSSMPAGSVAGCGLSCGSIHEPMRMDPDTSEPATLARNPKVAHGGDDTAKAPTSNAAGTEDGRIASIRPGDQQLPPPHFEVTHLPAFESRHAPGSTLQSSRGASSASQAGASCSAAPRSHWACAPESVQRRL